MSDPCQLKCRFCEQEFNSTYKVIPHIFFGHHKKIFKRISKKEELMYECPGGCDFKVSALKYFKPGCSSEELVSSLVHSLVTLEEHLNSVHTKEEKTVVCSCGFQLNNTIYWEHLQEHMGAVIVSTTPKKGKGQRQPGSKTVETPDSLKSSEASTSSITSVITPVLSEKSTEPAIQEIKSVEAEIKPDLPSGDLIEKVVASRTGNEGDKSTADMPVSSKPTSHEVNTIDSSTQPVSGTLGSTLPNQFVPVSDPRVISPPLKTAKLPGELAASTIPFSSYFKNKKPETSTELKPPEPSTELKPAEPSTELKPPEPSTELKPAETSTELKPPEPVVPPVRRPSGEKPKISLSEYTQLHKIRRHSSGDGSDKPEKPEPVPSLVTRSLIPAPLVASNEKLSVKERNVSGSGDLRSETERKNISWKLDKERRKSGSGDYPGESKPKPEISPRLEHVIIKGNIGLGGKVVEPMRPPTPLDRPRTPSVSPSPDGSRSTTPGERMSRPTTPLDRPLSASRRASSEQKPRRLSENYYPKEKPKPDLTEEMERQIIYGGFLKRRGKGKPEEFSPNNQEEERKEMKKEDFIEPEEQEVKSEVKVESVELKMKEEGPIEETIEQKQQRERREKRIQDEKDKLTREEKLAAVRREIEMRFQEEELKRMRDKEVTKKKENELREKIRIEEEKLRKEKEKIVSEKKRLKAEKKRSRKSKHKRRDSEVEVVDLVEDDVRPAKERRRESVDDEESKEMTPENIEPVKEKVEKQDQYEMLKMNFLSQRKQAIENEIRLLENVESESPPGEDVSERPGELAKEPEDVEDEEDDLEAMMREYREKEKLTVPEMAPAPEKVEESEKQSSLSFLMDSYGGGKKRSGSESPEASRKSTEVPPTSLEKTIPKGFDELGNPLDEIHSFPTDFDEFGRTVVADPSDRPVPAGFDADGHPLDGPKIKSDPMSEAMLRAANIAAMDIMAPAKQSRELKAASQLQCSLCKEDGAQGVYYSAYTLLSHVFLIHRKKIVSRSRKVRGMTLACPEGCGFITDMSKEQTSIDYFTNVLPSHLEELSEHIRDCHTGEPKMETCQYCSLPLQHEESWSWQHLANHGDERRFYCDSCNNFPFKTEVHKCPGTGLETYFSTSPGLEPSRKRRRSEDGLDARKTKSLEELAREVETGNLDMEKLVKSKNLGNMERYLCDTCDRFLPSLSHWLTHTRLEHLTRGHIKNSLSLRCFCCSWTPLRFEKGREIIGVNSLVQHLITEHHSEDWIDVEFEAERNKLTQIQRDMEKRLEREREEACITVPRLPANCQTCQVSIGLHKVWRYHVLAHKFGEVYCSSCNTCILGHHYQEHSAICNKEDKDRVRVQVEKFRGETWFDREGKKMKISFEMNTSKELGRHSVAKTIVFGNRFVRGTGSTHDEALRTLREEIESILTEAKRKVEEERKEDLEKEDKEKLLELFRKLAAVDKENEGKVYSLEVGGRVVDVKTRLYHTKAGKCKIMASAVYSNQFLFALGDNRLHSVQLLAEKVAELHKLNPEQEQSQDNKEFSCTDCSSRFKRKRTLELHQTQPCKI